MTTPSETEEHAGQDDDRETQAIETNHAVTSFLLVGVAGRSHSMGADPQHFF